MYIESVELPESEPDNKVVVKLDKTSDAYHGLVRSLNQDLERAKKLLTDPDGSWGDKVKFAIRGFLYGKTCYPKTDAQAVSCLYQAYHMSGIGRQPKVDRSYETELGFQSFEAGIGKK